MKQNWKPISFIKNNSSVLILEITVFLYLCFSLIVSVAPEINGWVGIWYGVDYSIGFSSRLFIGQLLHLLFGDYITYEVAYAFINVCFIIIFALLSKAIGYTYKNATDSQQQWAVVILAGMYLASPAAPGYLWTIENMGRLETYLFLLTLIIFFLGIFIKHPYIAITVCTIIAIICLAIHQVYMFLFFPLLLVVLIDILYSSQFKKSIWASIIVAVFLLCGICLFFQFGTHINFTDSRELTDYIQSKTSVYCDEGPIIQEYFWEFTKHITVNYIPDIPYRTRYGIINVFLLSPILIIFGYIWYKAIRNCSSFIEKSKYYLVVLTNVTFIPAFAILTDWGRWFATFFTIQFLVIFYLFCKKDEHVSHALQCLGEKIAKYPFLFIGIILYLCCFEKFEGCNNLNQAETFYYFAYKIKSWIFG